MRIPLFERSGGFRGRNPPRGSPRKFASQRVLKGVCGGLFEGSAGSPQGCGTLRGSVEFSEGSDPILVTLGNCHKLFFKMSHYVL